jgi:hypothetical protein
MVYGKYSGLEINAAHSSGTKAAFFTAYKVRVPEMDWVKWTGSPNGTLRDRGQMHEMVREDF